MAVVSCGSCAITTYFLCQDCVGFITSIHIVLLFIQASCGVLEWLYFYIMFFWYDRWHHAVDIFYRHRMPSFPRHFHFSALLPVRAVKETLYTTQVLSSNNCSLHYLMSSLNLYFAPEGWSLWIPSLHEWLFVLLTMHIISPSADALWGGQGVPLDGSIPSSWLRFLLSQFRKIAP